MKKFVEFLVVACVALLSWWQLQLHAELPAVTWFLIGVGGLGGWWTVCTKRAGYVIGLLLGIGYQTELLLRFGAVQLRALEPLLFWSAALAVLCAGLLWVSRERQTRPPAYERHSHF